MIISVATYNQLPIIKELAYQIWPIAYGDILSNRQLDYMLDLIYSIESLENQINKKQVFLLVSFENEYVGFASYELNFEDEKHKEIENNLNQVKTKIHKLYILPQIQGNGIGKKIIDYIKDIAIFNENSSIILNVNRFNKAKDFYLKYGFKITKEIKINIGNGYIMDDYVMELFF